MLNEPYVMEFLNQPFNMADLQDSFNVKITDNSEFVSIEFESVADHIMYYYPDYPSCVGIDIKGERFDMPAPRLMGDFVRYCDLLEIELKLKK